MQVNIDPVEYEIVAHRKTVKQDLSKIHKTPPRAQTSELDIFPYTNRKLIDIKDALGRKTKEVNRTPLFYIYDDGTVEKKIILE